MNDQFDFALNSAIQHSNNGNQVEAIEILQKCAIEQPKNTWVCLNLANSYIKNNQDAFAIKHIERVIELKPKDEKVLLNTNLLSLKIFRFDLALQACYVAESYFPKSLDVLAALIQAKKEARNNSGIKSLCKRMIDLAPKNYWPYSQLGYYYLGRGKFEPAEIAFNKALKNDPFSSFAIAGLVKCKKFETKPTKLINQINLTILKTEDLEEKTRLHLALAKILNDNGKYESAWEQASQGKALKVILAPFAQDKFTSHVDSLIETFQNPENRTTSENSNQHLFIVGMPRSGTTLIEQVLSTYSAHYPGGETPALDNAIFQVLKGNSYLSPKVDLNERKLNEIAHHYEMFFKRFSNFSGEKIIDKIPMHFMQIGFIKRIFPNAKFINFERNKFDVSTSILFENFNLRQNYTHTITDIFHVYDEYQKLIRFWQKLYSKDILTIKYNDFIISHDDVKKEILDFAKINIKEKSNYQSASNIIETPSVWQARQPVYKDSIDRWKRYSQMVKLASNLNELKS